MTSWHEEQRSFSLWSIQNSPLPGTRFFFTSLLSCVRTGTFPSNLSCHTVVPLGAVLLRKNEDMQYLAQTSFAISLVIDRRWQVISCNTCVPAKLFPVFLWDAPGGSAPRAFGVRHHVPRSCCTGTVYRSSRSIKWKKFRKTNGGASGVVKNAGRGNCA